MHSGFEAQAARTPHRLAVLAGDESCTYEQLNQRANRLAQYIRSRGIEPGQAIAVLHEPSIDMIVSLYAVLKSGCCYVPIAADFPQSRVDAILKDVAARAVLTTTACEPRFANVEADLILVDDWAELPACYVYDNLPATDPSALAYVLYTSGTTGQPRGIEIRHRGVAHMFAAVQHEYALGEDDRVLFHTPLTFDVSVQEIFWPLAVGATVVVAPGSLLKGARQIASLIERQAVTVAQFVPVMLEALVDARRKGVVSGLPALRQVILGGAVLSGPLNQGFREVFAAPLANHYGPTEVTVDAARFDCRQPFVGESTPIARPIANTRIVVLNAVGERVRRGIIGEIHVASPGLARGYVNDPTRTGELFVELAIDGTRQRLFRTGDLGSYDGSGVLHFHGRKDRQIKVRGNRVEIDEIVSALTSHPDIAVAAIRCVKDEAAGGRLVAYVEQDPSRNRLGTAAGPRYSFTLEQRPELVEAAEAWDQRRRPEFVGADPQMMRLWPRLIREFPDLQFVLTDEADHIDMVGHAVPLCVTEVAQDVSPAGLAPGWSEALRRAFARQGADCRPNALYVFAGAWAPAFEGGDDGAILLDRQRELATAHGLEWIVYARDPLGAPGESQIERLPLSSHRRSPLTRASVREFLKASLPAYMIPESVHFLPSIPMTESGKVDEKRLPHVDVRAGVERQAAETEMQKQLTALMQQILGTKAEIGVKDDFLVLGGQSLMAIELISEINDRYGSDVDLRAFYQEPTVEHLEQLLTRHASGHARA